MKKVKGFSFDTEKDKDVIDHIDAHPSNSEYIKELVREDMTKTQEEMIKQSVAEYFEHTHWIK